MINELSKKIHQNAVNKGFYEQEINIGEKLCLIHSEISEALEADRNNHHCNFIGKDKLQVNNEIWNNSFDENEWNNHPDFTKDLFEKLIKNSFEDELADTMIRIMDLAGYLNIDLERHILLKIKYNSTRAYKHGKGY